MAAEKSLEFVSLLNQNTQQPVEQAAGAASSEDYLESGSLRCVRCFEPPPPSCVRCYEPPPPCVRCYEPPPPPCVSCFK